MMVVPSLETASKFRGCLVGALLGDCLGAPFEFEKTVSRSVLQKYFDRMEDPSFKGPQKNYTDDTAMTKSIAETLIHHPKFDEVDLAKRFATEFRRDPRRGYGSAVGVVFNKWFSSRFEEVWRPAQEQFDGQGSAGNGAAMRISPVALFCYNDENQLIEFASKSSKLTHTHRLGVHGAILQALAIQQSFALDPKVPANVDKFSSDLIEKISRVESSDELEWSLEQDPATYQKQMKLVQKLLKKDNADVYEVVNTLGNDVLALSSVPTAIYCYLRAQQPIENIETVDPFRRALQYSISMGGDTDTIASMAGAITGAHLGIEGINPSFQKHCEGLDFMLKLAEDLHKVTFSL